ncbi:MAG: hypothetical protein JSS87_01070 [Acidobacteria bacterium]|nr:hypothetical protein [Acidobacteriota bacterium]
MATNSQSALPGQSKIPAQSYRGVRRLCEDGAWLLAAWLRAEPRLVAILPEMMALPPNLLVAGSTAGDLYLAHLRECRQCNPAGHA